MRLPRICDLPAPPEGKFGWPWTEESSALSGRQANGEHWPRISVVTPSYNQGQFIEETIRSVLLQGYPNLEYIVIDGGSNDSSIEIIKKYERWLSYWVSEKDHGQADAINKGLDHATGEIVNWLNSDDLLYWGALKHVALAYCEEPNAMLYNGAALRVDAHGIYGSPYVARQLTAESAFEGKIPLPQPAIFFRRECWLQHGKLKSFYYAMDTDLFFSCLVFGYAKLVSGPPLALMRIHNDAKTAKPEALRPMFLERFEIFSRLSTEPHIPAPIQRSVKYGLNRESLRIARVLASRTANWPEAFVWVMRAVRFSPKQTLSRLPDMILGYLHK